MAERNIYWKLDGGGSPVQAANLADWMGWLATSPARKVKLDTIGTLYKVSTSFMGIDRGTPTDKTPVLWETRVFHADTGEPADQPFKRGSEAAALDSHKRALRAWRAAAALETLMAKGSQGHDLS